MRRTWRSRRRPSSATCTVATARYRTKDVYCAPIRNHEGSIVGVLQLLNRTHPFTDEDEEFLEAISVHIGLALERAWLHRQLSEKRKIEQELALLRVGVAQTEKLSLMGELISTVVLEIKDPLVSLAGQCASLKDQAGLTPNLAERVDRLEQSAQQALKTVHNFLNFARKADCGRTLVHLNSLIQQMVEFTDQLFRDPEKRSIFEKRGAVATTR